MQDTAEEVGTNSYSCGSLHMDEQNQDNQLDPTYNIFVLIHDVALNNYKERWRMVAGEGRGVQCWWHDMMMMKI